MLIQLISDVHLEFRDGNYPFIPRRAPIIALLGDIGRPFSRVYYRLLKDLSKRFRSVLVIAGNHEFYSSRHRKLTITEIRAKLEEVTSHFDNVHYLENQSMVLDGVRFLGCTLWTNIPEDMWKDARKKMNDYRMCYIDRYEEINIGVPLSPTHTTFWHEESVRWLIREIDLSREPVVILSHHCPYTHETSSAEYLANPLNCCYSTNLVRLFRKPVVAWLYGHTHHPYNKYVNGVHVVSNPLGYPGELENEKEVLTNPPIVEV